MTPREEKAILALARWYERLAAECLQESARLQRRSAALTEQAHHLLEELEHGTTH